VLAEVKADAGMMAIPIVVLTTSQSERDILTAYGLHANCYITKPVDFKNFTQVVREIGNFWLTVVTLPPG
jgi:chemotaxis family two-component system response regulator Rcp1